MNKIFQAALGFLESVVGAKQLPGHNITGGAGEGRDLAILNILACQITTKCWVVMYLTAKDHFGTTQKWLWKRITLQI